MKERLFRIFPAPFAAAAAIFATAVLAFSGCSHVALGKPKAKAPAPSPAANFSGDKRLPASLRRVVLLPVSGGNAAPPESAAALDPVFATALEHQMRFEIVTLSREECRRRYGVESLSSADVLPAGFLDDLGRDYGAQGVMFVDITAFRTLRPMTIGVRAKLALVDSARLAWVIDDVFSAEDPRVEAGLHKFYAPAGGDTTEVPADLPEAALISPSRFGAYVADAAFRTLPAR